MKLSLVFTCLLFSLLTSEIYAIRIHKKQMSLHVSQYDGKYSQLKVLGIDVFLKLKD
ncbi:MAG: hypothetical protein ABI581_16280 [Sediminibacterium sp.]